MPEEGVDDGCISGSLPLVLEMSMAQVHSEYLGQRYCMVRSFLTGGGALHCLHLPWQRWMYAVGGGARIPGVESVGRAAAGICRDRKWGVGAVMTLSLGYRSCTPSRRRICRGAEARRADARWSAMVFSTTLYSTRWFVGWLELGMPQRSSIGDWCAGMSHDIGPWTGCR